MTMEIVLIKVSVADLCKGYTNKEEEGVFAYSGKLNVRPPYQREFVYKDDKKHAVIDTLSKGYPLNVMYWAQLGDRRYEIIDGQQRTLSICSFVTGDFSCRIFGYEGYRAFFNLPPDQQQLILNYELTVYLCSGTESERLEWFKTINIAGERLTDQELRNAVYSGPWVSDAKRYFSRTAGAAYGLGGDYLSGTAIRQEYLETVIDWISSGDINGYMSAHQHEADASDLWEYFRSVISWIKRIFPRLRKKEMKGLPWGRWYNIYKDDPLYPDELEQQITELMEDDEVTKKSGIYEYLLTGSERALSLRSFTDKQKREVYEHQAGICPHCKEYYEIDQMEGDHITPWSEGGRTTTDNLQMLCRSCNRRKGAH